MKVTAKTTGKKKQAFVLLVTVVFLIIVLIALVSTMTWIITNSTQTQHDNQFIASEYAAEGATEKVLGQMDYDWLAGTLGTATYYATMIPTNTADWPVKYVFSDSSGNSNQISVVIGQQQTNWVVLPSPYTGLKAYITPCQVTATAKPIGQRFNIPATVSQTFDITSIPIFQYIIFYNMNLEIAAASTLDINGPVFSNAGLWSGSTTITFDQTVWAVSKTLVNGANNPFVTYTGSGSSTYTMAGEPVSGVNHVTMPIAGTNNNPSVVESILQWPPSGYALGSSAAYTPNGEVYLANYADLIISNAASGVNSTRPAGTNFFVYYEDPSQPANSNSNNFCSSITWVTNDFYIITNTTHHTISISNSVPGSQWTDGSGNRDQIWYAGYSFLTNVLFYDWREGWSSGNAKTVQAVQFDVTKYNLWLSNAAAGGNYNAICNSDKNHSIGGVYIYTSVPMTTSVLPAVRVVNGSQLYDSYGLSIATPMPLYVEGNFNVTDGSGNSDAATIGTAHSRPASFLADAITVLSSGYSDTSTAKAPSVSPSTTTIHAACLEGIVPSDSSLPSGGDNSNYSGGVENFLRLLENWGTLYYNGSIVVMFPSQYATNRWRQTGNYYVAPSRIWSFDTNFTVRAKLPPFTPQMKTTLRSTWTGN